MERKIGALTDVSDKQMRDVGGGAMIGGRLQEEGLLSTLAAANAVATARQKQDGAATLSSHTLLRPSGVKGQRLWGGGEEMVVAQSSRDSKMSNSESLGLTESFTLFSSLEI